MSTQNNALFERVSIIRTEERIPPQGKQLRNNKPYTVYVIRVKAAGTTWIVTRRYREFRALHLSLCKMLKYHSKRMQKQQKNQQKQTIRSGNNSVSSKFRSSLSVLTSPHRSKRSKNKTTQSVNDPYFERNKNRNKNTQENWMITDQDNQELRVEDNDNDHEEEEKEDESFDLDINEDDVLSDVDNSSTEDNLNNDHDSNLNNNNNINDNNNNINNNENLNDEKFKTPPHEKLHSSITKDWDKNRISSPTVLLSNEPSFLDDRYLNQINNNNNNNNNINNNNNNNINSLNSISNSTTPPSPSFNPRMLPDFPGRSLGGSTNPETVEKRKEMLENYVQHICIFEPQLCFTTQVLSFLDIQASPVSYLFDHMFTDSSVNRSKFTLELRECKRDLMRQIEEQRRVLNMLSEQEKELNKFRLEIETAPTLFEENQDYQDESIDSNQKIENESIDHESDLEQPSSNTNTNNTITNDSSSPSPSSTPITNNTSSSSSVLTIRQKQLEQIEVSSRKLDKRYNVHMDVMERLKRHLTELRLKGDEFFNVRIKQIRLKNRKMNFMAVITVDPSGRIFIRKQDITDLRVTMGDKTNTNNASKNINMNHDNNNNNNNNNNLNNNNDNDIDTGYLSSESNRDSFPNCEDNSMEIQSFSKLKIDNNNNNNNNNNNEKNNNNNNSESNSDQFSLHQSISASNIIEDILTHSFHQVIQSKPEFTIEKTEHQEMNHLTEENVSHSKSSVDSSIDSETFSSPSNKVIDIIYMHEISKLFDKTFGSKQQDRYRSDGMGEVILEFKNSPNACILETKESVEFMEVLGAQLKQYNISRMNTCSYLRSRWLRRQIPFNEKDNDHEKALIEFWDLVSPDFALPARKCKEWERVGFQGKDPATDFRGMGILGLDNLIYMARKEPKFCTAVVKKQQSYPFAVGCINITSMLFDILKISEDLIHRQGVASSSWDTPLFHLMCREFSIDSEAKPFEEIYIIACKLLDKIWNEWDAGYMQFGSVLAECKKRLQETLNVQPNNVSTVAQLVGVDNYYSSEN